MVRPQSESLNRSGTTPLTPDSIESELEARRQPTDTDGPTGPVPEANQPGHHPEHEQDKPTGPPATATSGVEGDEE